MPTQVYLCPHHGEFDAYLTWEEDVPKRKRCHGCGRMSRHVLKPPAAIIVEGGTGAGRGNAQVRKELRWDTKANELQHDPYTQAKAQLESVYNRARDKGRHPTPVTEAGIQAAAAQIAAGHSGPTVEQRPVKRAKTESKKVRAARKEGK